MTFYLSAFGQLGSDCTNHGGDLAAAQRDTTSVAVASRDSGGLSGGGSVAGLGSSSSASVGHQTGARTRVRVDTTHTRWTGSEGDITQTQRGLRRNIVRLKNRCEVAAYEQLGLKGRLVLAFEAPAERSLTDIEFTKDDTGHKDLAHCVLKPLR